MRKIFFVRGSLQRYVSQKSKLQEEKADKLQKLLKFLGIGHVLSLHLVLCSL